MKPTDPHQKAARAILKSARISPGRLCAAAMIERGKNPDDPSLAQNKREDAVVAIAAILREHFPGWIRCEEFSFDPAEHHGSCRPSDVDLYWCCGQCGHKEWAADGPEPPEPER